MNFKKSFIIIIFLFSSYFFFGQNTRIGNWFIYFGNQKINNKCNWWNEIQYRNYNFMGDIQQLLLRTGIGFNLNENNNNLLLGYAFINSENYLQNSSNKVGSFEHRIYQQFITRQNFGRFFFQHRYRVEERLFSGDFRLRFRYFLSLNIPINNKSMAEKTIYLSTYNEVFINNQKSNFDRNRFFSAIGYVINKNFRIECGLMNQAIESSNRNQFQIVIFNNLTLNKE